MKLTQEEVASVVGINARYLSKVENDRAKPSADLVGRLIHAMQADANEILGIAHVAPGPLYSPYERSNPDA